MQNPADAFLSEKTKRLLEEARKRFPVGIISGRDLNDLMGRVGIEGIAYAGSDGLEIAFTNGDQNGSLTNFTNAKASYNYSN